MWPAGSGASSSQGDFQMRMNELRLLCNDIHSQLNSTTIRGRLAPTTLDEAASFVHRVRSRGEFMSVCGSCHAMGGQQFAADGWLLDMRGMNRVIDFDRQRGVIHVQAGITWPDLIRQYVVAQRDGESAWGIKQKQTGADRLTLGGAVSANIHGRGLAYAPFVSDIEALEVILADGSVVHCDREMHADLFRHVVGGYGLFGVVASVQLRLVPRQKVERVVELCDVDEIGEAFEERIRTGYLYGDFQFSTAADDLGFLSSGVFSCYRPVDPRTVVPEGQIRLSPADWRRLIYLAHHNKRRAFHEFTDFYLRSSGQIYWSDTHQLSVYLDDYHGGLDRACEAPVPGSEMITELYVPRTRLAAFMSDVRRDFQLHGVDLVYGTVRLIKRDSETALAWAREDYACVIFNLHVDHEPRSISRSSHTFRRLIDIAIHHRGSFFLTYHRYAIAAQLLACYPQLPEFLQTKQRFDPDEVFRSDWYRYYQSIGRDVEFA
jgi:FAD/FMN-containing dehydrogenase